MCKLIREKLGTNIDGYDKLKELIDALWWAISTCIPKKVAFAEKFGIFLFTKKQEYYTIVL